MVKEIRRTLTEKWQRRYLVSKVKESFQEVFPEVGEKKAVQVGRSTDVVINQLITGHCQLNVHMAKILEDRGEECQHCGQVETVIHYVYDCPHYNMERQMMEREAEDIIHRFNEEVAFLDLGTLLGFTGKTIDMKKELRAVFQKFINITKRFN